MLALPHAPGTLRFAEDEVPVTLVVPLPPNTHPRRATALADFDSRGMKNAERLDARPADSKSLVRNYQLA